MNNDTKPLTPDCRENAEGLEIANDVESALSNIINVAAHLVQGACVPSYDRSEYGKNVPDWLLRKLDEAHDNLKVNAGTLKYSVDTIRTALNRLKQGE